MKAAVYYETGGPDVFRYEDVPDPVVGDGEVLVRVEAISIEGGDTLNRLRRRPDRGAPHRGLPVRRHGAWPRAQAVDRVTVGDRVVTVGSDGSHAELRAVAEPFCWVIPDGARHRGGGLRAGPLRHGRRLPVRVRAAAGGRDRTDPRRRQRCGHRRHPAGEAGRGPGARHGVQRRRLDVWPSSVSTTGSTTPPWTSWTRCAGSPTGGGPT